MRPIDADALMKILKEAHDSIRRICLSLNDYRDKEVCKGELGTYATVERMVEKAPTIDPESLRPKGRWVTHTVGHGKYADNYVECSECKTVGSPRWKCCPVCEAKMEGEA